MSRRLRIGILGCARIVKRGVAAAIQRSAGGELAAIASSRPGVAGAWARELGIPRSFDSYAALVADREIDAVYIPLPNEQHAEWTLAAAKAGKHVLCEKPLGLDLAEARRMVEGCRAAGVTLMEAFMWRHHPRTTRAVEWVREGKLGRLRLVKMDFSFPIDPSDWRLDPQRGGGALYDLGCYAINAGRLFAGSEPVEVFARARMSASGVDMTTALVVRFEGDVQLVADCSFEAPYRNRLEIVGSEGSLELPEGVLPGERPELWLRTGEQTERIEGLSGDQYQGEVEAFCRGVATGTLPAPAEDGLANMAALDAARQMAWSTAMRGGGTV